MVATADALFVCYEAGGKCNTQQHHFCTVPNARHVVIRLGMLDPQTRTSHFLAESSDFWCQVWSHTLQVFWSIFWSLKPSWQCMTIQLYKCPIFWHT
jgi:hypothetical protein